jgi:NAD(P)-dependent dehydrogenase (short-subunit alcohol dehydrogenase family)
MSKSTTSLSGKAALVTGAATGIGKAIAAALAAAGGYAIYDATKGDAAAGVPVDPDLVE